MNDQVDMAQFIEARSDQLNSDDLIGVTKTITVTRVTGNDGEQPISVHYEGDNGKPFKPCKTIRRVLMAVWGRYASEYTGRSMTVYRDDKVTFGGLEVGGIRISHMSHLDKETIVVVAKSKGKKAGMKILPLAADTKADKAADGVQTLVARIGSVDPKNLAGLIDDPVVVKQRAWLADKRPELAARIDKAIAGKAGTETPALVDDANPLGLGIPETGDEADDHPAVAKAADIKSQAMAAQDKQTLMVVKAEFWKHRAAIEAYDEALAVNVNNAVLIAEQRLGV